MNLSSPIDNVISVSELNHRVCNLLEKHFSVVTVTGEISNFKRYDSGHCYFFLKDAGAQVRCVMFRSRAMLLNFQPNEGIQVEARAAVSLYEVRGEFQLTVDMLQPSGLGALFEAFDRLKRRLESEGLFDSEKKRHLPLLPSSIGIVTSPAAAALHDVLITLKRRFPSIPLVLYPTPVQGADASQHIASAILKAGLRSEVDVLIVCRGGGRLEDLWAFNEEIVARAIANSPIPIVTGIGHETDFTIADFVADVRAPTPTAAAERASPNQDEWCSYLNQRGKYFRKLFEHSLQCQMQRLDHLAPRLRHPGKKLILQQQKIADFAHNLQYALQGRKESSRYRITMLRLRIKNVSPNTTVRYHHLATLKGQYIRTMQYLLQQYKGQLSLLTARLDAGNPKGLLQKGYTLVTKMDGTVVHIAQELQVGDMLKIQFASGSVAAIVSEVS